MCLAVDYCTVATGINDEIVFVAELIEGQVFTCTSEDE